MNNAHIPFGSIEQFRHVIREVNHDFGYVGLDAENQPIYDYTKPKPVIDFSGTVKIHGTQAGVSYNGVHLYAQSNNQVISVDKDNAGFAKFVADRESWFRETLQKYVLCGCDQVVLFGEFAGKGINKGAAICELPEKTFFVFGLLTIVGTDIKWLTHDGIYNHDLCIYNINEFDTFKISVDFNKPELSKDILTDLTLKIEEKCPVASEFGINGIGEGIVWTGSFGGKVYRFKTKGEKHSVVKAKTLVEVDIEKLSSVCNFVNYAVTKNRVVQACTEICGNAVTITKMGDIIRWVFNDIIKEESDTLEASGLTAKDVSREVGNKARLIFKGLLWKLD